MPRVTRNDRMTEIEQVREALANAMQILRIMPLSYQDTLTLTIKVAGIQPWARAGGRRYASPCAHQGNASANCADGALA